MENEVFEEIEFEIYDDLPIIEHVDWDHANDDEWYSDAFGG